MPERAVLTLRLEPTAQRRLEALAHRLSLSKSAVLHLALAKLAQAEGLHSEQEPPA